MNTVYAQGVSGSLGVDDYAKIIDHKIISINNIRKVRDNALTEGIMCKVEKSSECSDFTKLNL